MNAGTHVAFASVLYLGGAALFEYRPDLTGWALAATASLLPDIDLPTSKVGRAVWFLSTRLERRFGHRTITHSFFALFMLGLLISPLFVFERGAWWWAIIGGYWSHIWIDMLNLRGADLFWPSPARFVMPGNRRYRMEVGSKAEMILLVCLIGFALLLYPVSGQGFRTGLAHLLGNFDMAQEEFIKHAGQNWYSLRTDAIDNLTLERVQGEFPVVGVWKNGMIIKQGGRLRAIGHNLDAHNLRPIHVELIEGEPLKVVSRQVEMQGRPVGWLIDQLEADRTLYISGELRLGSGREEPINDLMRYRPAWMAGSILVLHYARPADLEPYRVRVAAEGEVVIQTWLHEGDPPVTLAIEEPLKVETIPKALQPFL
ncbi:metal-dependent hydrolase [Allochromatium vinosum]|uniref:Membrane-bound metal-dependent hydrolase n=1 Tax=Allochromatium vinosum (strain ATCC 17899 / DSM 180 / NBRC 103801 / NCIMB 10441 / D) TaxID=572477 RepID=D3RW98_ALLVD|nr:metal-dependent hydrolase [Allochromatium vinosum]ADC64110.1 membrane-bound metal-dependent hydrolase [Allochromatium vinosum DSM 180]